ncbi:hypothetical protein K9L67_05270 [Candidatus Woesearchaeota archaeon]|nr:hypothetical protein [Candidatus Woesearchaeota archaeon]MCF7901609.1 hypothetical protein [Candidatus Woesearchaeota archaeon]MCF8013518.1 hypothetical protein [Candidatus Woesearchaeota archaeon]
MIKIFNYDNNLQLPKKELIKLNLYRLDAQIYKINGLKELIIAESNQDELIKQQNFYIKYCDQILVTENALKEIGNQNNKQLLIKEKIRRVKGKDATSEKIKKLLKIKHLKESKPNLITVILQYETIQNKNSNLVIVAKNKKEIETIYETKLEKTIYSQKNLQETMTPIWSNTKITYEFQNQIRQNQKNTLNQISYDFNISNLAIQIRQDYWSKLQELTETQQKEHNIQIRKEKKFNPKNLTHSNPWEYLHKMMQK